MRMLAIVATVLALTPQISVSAECEALPDKVEHFIRTFAANIRGAEYCRFRNIAHGRLTAESAQDLVVVFNVEGACNEDKTPAPGSCGNTWNSYMKVFLGPELKEGPFLQLKIHQILQLRITDNTIVADVLRYGPNDSRAQPTVPGQDRYFLREGKIVEAAEGTATGPSGAAP